MHLTRLRYDDCYYKHAVEDSSMPGKYVIETGLQECAQVFPTNPYIRQSIRHAPSYSHNWVDIHSELSGRSRSASLCPEMKFLPGQKFKFEDSIFLAPDSKDLHTEDTKLSNPPCSLRETGINRWEWLCDDPQARAIAPFDMSIQNRILVKNNFVPCVPKPFPQDAALPPKQNMDVEMKYNCDLKCPR